MANKRDRLTRCIRLTVCTGLLALLLLGPAGCGGKGDSVTTSDEKPPAVPEAVAIEISGRAFDLELAVDPEAIVQGLSDRESIAADGGMLFVLPYARRAMFVMRRCYVPIDLVYIDEKGYIDSLHRMQVIEPVGGPLWRNPTSGYPSVGAVRYVIEFKGGTLDELGLSRGEKLDLPFEQLQSYAQ